MFKILSITVQTSIILILVLAVFNNSFIISFEIKDFIYSVSSTYIFIPLLIFFVLIFLLQTFYFKTKFSFSKFIAIKKLQNSGYNASKTSLNPTGFRTDCNIDDMKKIFEN